MADEKLLQAEPTMDTDILDRLYKVPNVNRKQYFSRYDRTGVITPMVEPADTRILNGGFVSEFGGAFHDAFVIGMPQTLGYGARLGAESLDKYVENKQVEIQKANERGDPVSMRAINAFGAKVFANKLSNFSMYLADKVNQELQIKAATEGESTQVGKVGKFLGEAGSSIVKCYGLLATGMGTAGVATAFGVESGLGVFGRGREAGASFEKSLAWGAFSGVLNTGMEMAGLDAIFKGTFHSGKNVAKQAIFRAVGTEALTEAGQQSVEIIADIGTGARADITVEEALSEVVYASALGAVAGGVMTAAVAIPQRSKAIKMMKSFGYDQATATQAVDIAMQETMDLVTEKMAKDQGATPDVLEGVQFYRDLVNGNVTLDQAQIEATIERQQRFNSSKQTLAAIRAEASATARAELAEKEKGERIGTKTADVAAQQVLAEEGPTVGEVEGEFEPKAPFNLQIPVSEETGLPKLSGILFPRDMSVSDRINVRGRLTQIPVDLKPLVQQRQTLAQQLMGRTIEGKAPESIAKIEERLAKVDEKIFNLQAEYEALFNNPADIQVIEGKVVLSQNAILRQKLANIRAAMQEYNRGYRKGVSSVRAEYRWVRAAISSLANTKGLTQKQQKMIKGMYASIQTEHQLASRIPDIQRRITNIIASNQIEVFQDQISQFVDMMKGKKTSMGFQPKLGKDPSTGVDTQKVANAFVNEFNKKDTDPGELRQKFKNTPEFKARLVASQLATGKNAGTGEDLTVDDYARFYEGLRDLLTGGRQGYYVESRAKEIAREAIKERVLEGINAQAIDVGKVAGIPVNDILDKALTTGISIIQDYDTVLSTIFRHVGDTIGGSPGEQLMNVTRETREAESRRLLYTTQLDAGLKDIYGLTSQDALREKLTNDSDVEATNHVELTLDNGDVVTLSRAAAIEKALIALRPRGHDILTKHMGWTEQTISQLHEQLTEADQQYVDLLLELNAKLYPILNEAFRKLKGYDLPQDRNYSTLYVEGFDLGETNFAEVLLAENGAREADVTDVSMLKAVTAAKVTLQDIPAHMKMEKYIRDVTYFAAMAEKVDMINNILSDNDIRRAIDKRFGQKTTKVLDRFRQVLTRNSTRTDTAQLTSGLNKIITRIAQGYLVFKPSQILKQTTSGVAAIERVGMGNFLKSFASLPNAIQSGEILDLVSDPYFASRYRFRNISLDLRIIQEMIQSQQGQQMKFDEATNEQVKWLAEQGKKVDKLTKNPTFLKWAFMTTTMGDFGGALVNGWAVYQQELQKTGDKEQAVLTTIDHINDTQQSPDYTKSSAALLNPNPMTRAFGLFKHTPLQYMNRVWRQFNTLGTEKSLIDDGFGGKKISPEAWKTFGNTYMTYYFLLPMLYTYVSKAFRKDDLDEMAARAFVGPFDNAMIAGPMFQYATLSVVNRAMSAITGEKLEKPSAMSAGKRLTVLSSIITNMHDANRALDKIIKDGGPTATNVLRLTTEISEATIPFTGVIGGASRAASNFVEGVAYGAEGEFVNNWRRWMMLLGFSERSTRGE